MARRKQSATGELAKSFQIESEKTGEISRNFILFTDIPYYEERELGRISEPVTDDRIEEWLHQKNEFQDAGWSSIQIAVLAPRMAEAINEAGGISSGRIGWEMKRDVYVGHRLNIAEKAKQGFRFAQTHLENILNTQAINMVREQLLHKPPIKYKMPSEIH